MCYSTSFNTHLKHSHFFFFNGYYTSHYNPLPSSVNRFGACPSLQRAENSAPGNWWIQCSPHRPARLRLFLPGIWSASTRHPHSVSSHSSAICISITEILEPHLRLFLSMLYKETEIETHFKRMGFSPPTQDGSSNYQGWWLVILGNLQSALGQGQGELLSLKSGSALLQKRPEKRHPPPPHTKHTRGVTAAEPESSYGNSEITNTQWSLIRFTSGKSTQTKRSGSSLIEILSVTYWWGTQAWSEMGENICYSRMEVLVICRDSAQSVLWVNDEEVGSDLGSTIPATITRSLGGALQQGPCRRTWGWPRQSLTGTLIMQNPDVPKGRPWRYWSAGKIHWGDSWEEHEKWKDHFLLLLSQCLLRDLTGLTGFYF